MVVDVLECGKDVVPVAFDVGQLASRNREVFWWGREKIGEGETAEQIAFTRRDLPLRREDEPIQKGSLREFLNLRLARIGNSLGESSFLSRRKLIFLHLVLIWENLEERAE